MVPRLGVRGRMWGPEYSGGFQSGAQCSWNPSEKPPFISPACSLAPSQVRTACGCGLSLKLHNTMKKQGKRHSYLWCILFPGLFYKMCWMVDTDWKI